MKNGETKLMEIGSTGNIERTDENIYAIALWTHETLGQRLKDTDYDVHNIDHVKHTQKNGRSVQIFVEKISFQE